MSLIVMIGLCYYYHCVIFINLIDRLLQELDLKMDDVSES